MTRIESGVTIPKGLFTLYLNVKKVTAKIFGRHSTWFYNGRQKKLAITFVLRQNPNV
jgi:hypothetical protein